MAETGPDTVGRPVVAAAQSLAEPREFFSRRLAVLLGEHAPSSEALAHLSRRMSARTYSAGEPVVRQGVRGDFMAVVTRGQLAVRRPTSDQHPILMPPGTVFGEAMLLEGAASQATVFAASDCELLVLRGSEFREALAAHREAQIQAPPRRLPIGIVAAAVIGIVLAASAALIAYNALRPTTAADTIEPWPAPSLEAGEHSDIVQLIAPWDGQVLVQVDSVPVRAAVAEAGFVKAALEVDGQLRGTLANTSLETIPWIVEWTWTDAAQGKHTMAVRVVSGDGRQLVSARSNITIVPAGELLFTSNRTGSWEIHSMGTHGHDVQALSAGPGDVRQPDWSSRRGLVCSSLGRPGTPVVRWVTQEGSGPVDLASGHDGVWSPDGAHIAYTSSVEGISQVFVRPVPDGEPVQVTSEEVYAGQPAWSPDGARIAYVAERHGNQDIWVVDLATGAVDQLTKDPGMDWGPAWAPDGIQLAFVSNREGSHQIYTSRNDGTGPQRRTELARGAESPAWSPDGRWLAFVAYTGDAAGVNAREIHVMTADGEVQVRLTYNDHDDSDPAWGSTE